MHSNWLGLIKFTYKCQANIIYFPDTVTGLVHKEKAGDELYLDFSKAFASIWNKLRSYNNQIDKQLVEKSLSSSYQYFPLKNGRRSQVGLYRECVLGSQPILYFYKLSGWSRVYLKKIANEKLKRATRILRVLENVILEGWENWVCLA